MKLTDRDAAYENHRYKLPNGQVCTSVTAVTSFPDNGKSMGFAYAAAKLAKQGIWFKDEWDKSRDNGSALHKHFENWLYGKPVEATEDEVGFLNAVELCFKEHDLTPVEIEAVVLSYDGWGGRLDVMTEPAIVDAKFGKQHAMEHCVQVNAYNNADGIARYAEDGSLASLDSFKQRELTVCAYFHGDGTYDWVEYPNGPEWYELFLALLNGKTKYAELEKRIRRIK